MYQQIITELNNFLREIRISENAINPEVFQGVFIKKLSNQNIIKSKRRINAGKEASTVNQTHIDITGRNGKLFFFETLSDTSTPTQNIDVDLFDNNLRYLSAIDFAQTNHDSESNTFFVRGSVSVPAALLWNDKLIYSSAYKKYGHSGEQVQLNIPDSNEAFTLLQRTAFQDDALVMLRYDYHHYLAILIPAESCDNLYSIPATCENQNVNLLRANLSVPNPNYNADNARNIQREQIERDAMDDEVDLEILQNRLLVNPFSGTDIKRVAKARVSQGAFRRLLLLENNHQCRLCDITTTSALRASHIKEWAECTRTERIDSNNGLLLCANHDALFDRHLISFDPDSGNICISSSLDDQQRESLNLSDTAHIILTEEMKPYMEKHYQKFMDRERT